MKKNSLSATVLKRTAKASSALFEVRADARFAKHKKISEEKLAEILDEIKEKLNEGLSSAAEEIIVETLDNYQHTENNRAKLTQLLSYTYETQGRYKESLETIEQYDDENLLAEIKLETQICLITQLAIAFNNTNDFPKAVALLNYALEEATAGNLKQLFGSIYVAFARVYKKLNEFPISRDYAEKALDYYREMGDWRGMAESYQGIAATYPHEGNSEKSLEFFDLAIKIIGSRTAPYLLGKIYSDMSGAYWFLRRPQDGIACLEKSIKFFEQTEHKIQATAAYNNLGLHLVMRGEWNKAEAAYNRALELATEANHVHVAGILDSLGELKILRGDFAEAQRLLEKSVALATERKKEWYAIQSLRNLARTLLMQSKLSEAAERAIETINLCQKIGESQVLNMARLVLAEVRFEEGSSQECERELALLEEANPSSDFFLLGNIQRVRGLMALDAADEELAVNHFSSSLTIFEAAEDVYHTALANHLIGTALANAHPHRAKKHLTAARETFNKLGVEWLLSETEKALGKLQTVQAPKIKTTSVSSQLLVLRLAEATVSRELLLRELVAILQQESRAQKIIVAEINDGKRFYPYITHGYAPNESLEIIGKFQEAHRKNETETFAKAKNVKIFNLRSPNSPPAFLFVSPANGAFLNDESSLMPLIRVVELGMDVCALREKERLPFSEQETNSISTNSLMPGFIHSSTAMTALVEEIYKIRSSDVTVLVTGESGTGKELVSRAIHASSNRKDKIFVPFNCTAVPKELAEGHLFGYKKGAFTGAVNDSQGMIRAADGGTLFLDEVGDLPLDVQPKLLRFLQEGEVQPLGEKQPVKVDVRVIAATNMPLEEKVASGAFREDLYYRLNVIRLRVPPLRERRSEIPPMINFYINQYSERFNKRDIVITPQTIDLLMVCDWAGNVRQLCNEVQRIVARAQDGEKITPEHLSPELKRSAHPISAFGAIDNVRPIASFDNSFASFNVGSTSGTLEEAVSELETQMIKNALSRHRWNISRVADELGLTRRGLYMKIARYGIQKAA